MSLDFFWWSESNASVVHCPLSNGQRARRKRDHRDRDGRHEPVVAPYGDSHRVGRGLQRLVDAVHVFAEGGTDLGSQRRVDFSRDELDVGPCQAVQGGHPLLHPQEVVRVPRVFRESYRHVRRAGIREGVLEALREVTGVAVRLPGRHADGKVVPVVGFWEERLGVPVLDLVARTALVLRLQAAVVCDGVVAHRAIRVVLLDLEAWDGSAEGRRPLEQRLGGKPKLPLEGGAVRLGDA